MTTYRDNINFRMLSTKLLEQYKSNSYIVLSELMKFENKISTTSKNIVLLNIDSMFRWLTYIEKIFFRLSDNLNYNEIVAPLSIYLEQTVSSIEESILVDRESFDISITAPWLEIFRFNIRVLNSYLNHDIDKYSTDSMLCYNDISSFINLFIYHNLYVLNEIDNCKFANSLFLNYDNFTIHFISPKMNVNTEYLAFRYFTYTKHFKNLNSNDIDIFNKSNDIIHFDKLYRYDTNYSKIEPIDIKLNFK